MNMSILTKEFTIGDIVNFIKNYFNHDKYADTILEETVAAVEELYLPEINATLEELESQELIEFSCVLPEITCSLFESEVKTVIPEVEAEIEETPSILSEFNFISMAA